MEILNKIKFNHYHMTTRLRYLVIVLLIINAISCSGCGNKKNATNTSLNLTLSTNKQEYHGSKELAIELLIAHKNPDTNQHLSYDNLSLEIVVTQENSTEESLIEYETFDTSEDGIKKQVNSVIEELGKLFKPTNATSATPTKQLKKIFTILPKGNPSKIIVSYKLLDSSNSNDVLEQCVITWHSEGSSNYELTLDGESNSLQAPDPINLKINKKQGSIQKDDLDSLVLEVIREAGDATLGKVDADGNMKLKFVESDLVLKDGIIKKALIVTPGKAPENKFKLFIKDGTYTSLPIDVIYKNSFIGGWEFEVIGANPTTHTKTLEDSNKNIEIKIYKPKEAIITPDELKDLRLHIKRTTPGTAKIGTIEDGIVELKDVNMPILAANKKSATKTLQFNSFSDKNATFELQLQDKTGAKVGSVQKIIWRNGAQLEIKTQYNVSTKDITITVQNAGKLILPANQAKLTWNIGHNTVKIDGQQRGSEDIPELKSTQEHTFVLRNVHFDDPINVPSAILNVELTWQQLDNPIKEGCTLTALPIDITVNKLEFNRATNQIVYSIQNNSSNDVNLKIRCINTQPNEKNAAIITTPLPIQLNLTKAGTVGSRSGEKFLQADLKNEISVDFKFELLLGNHPINFKYDTKDGSGEKGMNQTIVTCKVKEVKLKFMDSNGHEFPSEGISLQGDNKEIKFTIGSDNNSEDLVGLNELDKTRLKLLLTTTAGDAKITEGINTITDIQGNKLNLRGENTLKIKRGATNQAYFKLLLMYDIKGDGNFTKELASLMVSWKEDQFEISLINPIENNELTGILLQNITGNIIPANIEIELKNLDGATFQFSKKQDGNFVSLGYSHGSLQKILENNVLINKQTNIGPIYFGLVDANNKDNTEVYIVVNKDGYEVARTSQLIRSQAKKIVDVKIADIQTQRISIERNLLIDKGSDKDITKGFSIILKNNGENISTNDINIELTNTHGVQFSLSKGIDNNISFAKESTKEFILQLNDKNPPPFTKITLIISSKHGDVLDKKELLWVNDFNIEELIQAANLLSTKLDEIAGDTLPYSFGNILQNITDHSNIGTDKETLLNALNGAILYGSIDLEQKHIENSGLNEILPKIKNILAQLQKFNKDIKAANNDQEIEVIKQAIDEVQYMYNQGTHILENKVVEFAQKILLVGQKHIKIANIQGQRTGLQAEREYNKIFKPLEEVLKRLISTPPTPASPPKNIDHPLNRVFKEINTIIAATHQEIAEKYIKDGQNFKASIFTMYAKRWQEGADSYTGVTL